MSDRLDLLKNAYNDITSYTRTGGPSDWRPGLVDLFIYNNLVNAYEEAEIDGVYRFTDTPDNIMLKIIDSGYFLDLEYGIEQLHEDLDDYLRQNGYIVDVDTDDEDEVQ